MASKFSNSDRRTSQRTVALKPVNYLPAGSRKRAASSADQTAAKKQKKDNSGTPKSGGSKSVSSNRHQERKIRQHEAPDILSNSDNESQRDISSLNRAQRQQTATAEPVKAPTKVKVTRAQQEQDEHTDAHDSDEESEDDEQDDEVTDLQTLNRDALKITFASERPQWNDHNRTKTRRYQAQEVDSHKSDDDGSPETNQQFSMGHSQFNTHADDQDEYDTEDDTPPRKPKELIGPKKVSKREMDRLNEVPRWSNSEPMPAARPTTRYQQKSKVIILSDSDSNSTGDESNPTREVSRLQDSHINKGWPTEAFFVPPKRGSRIISLKDQPAPLNKTLSRAIREAIGDVLFDSAFPSIDENYKYHRKLLRRCARELKFDQLAERFGRDVDFGIVMARLIQQRISNLRGLFKSKGRSRVEATFLLISNDPNTIVKVENLTQRTEYIFKPNNNGVGHDKLAPFRHPSIIAILQDVVFKGSRGSALSKKHSTRFPTIPATERHPKRRMISEAMVCMAATAVHAVLDDWRSGREIPSDFNADLYQGVYDSHLEFMRYTHEGNLAGYQYMMAKIYEECCVITSGNIAISNKAMAILDLHNMPVD